MQKFLHSVEATTNFGKHLGALISKGMVIYFIGDLGVGKTTIIKGMLKGLNVIGNVKSPSYSIVEPYVKAKYPTYHFDLYRLFDPEELEFLGIREYFSPESVCLVEWADKGNDFLPKPDVVIKLISLDDDSRKIILSSISNAGQAFVESITLNS